MNEIHDAQQRHSLSCAIQHIAPQSDKLIKNSCADGRNIGGLAMVAHLYDCMILRMAVYWRCPVYRLMVFGVASATVDGDWS